jgi:excisionase family DNA binding protein
MKLISREDAANMMRVSVKTVDRMFNRGKLTRIKVESATRILEEEVFAYLEKRGLKAVAL